MSHNGWGSAREVAADDSHAQKRTYNNIVAGVVFGLALVGVDVATEEHLTVVSAIGMLGFIFAGVMLAQGLTIATNRIQNVTRRRSRS